MSRTASFRLLGLGALAALLCVAAAPPEGDPTGAEPEDLARWSHYLEVPLPEKPGKYVDFLLPPSAFGAARPDLGDLRLVDASGKVVPYALRVRTPVDEVRDLPGRTFDRGTNPDHSAQLTLDLGENPAEYDRVTVDVPGQAYSRTLRVEGSNDGRDWVKLLDGARVVDLDLERGRRLEQREFSFPPTRYRYLRVRVWPDKVLENDRPALNGARASRLVRDPGETVTHDASLGRREPVRQFGQPASAWDIDLGQPKVPVSRVTLTLKEGDFTRPFQLFGATNEWLASGGGEAVPERVPDMPGDLRGGEVRVVRSPDGVHINFPESQGRKLRLMVTDSRNPPLVIARVRYSAPARQVIFSPPEGAIPPFRLYAGNPMAPAPNYDFAARLPARLTPPPVRVEPGEARDHPIYVPPPKPWTERWPHLTDAILVAACAALGAILLRLAREAIRRHDDTVSAGAATGLPDPGAR